MQLSIRSRLSTRHPYSLACQSPLLVAATIASTLTLASLVESSPVDRTSPAKTSNTQRTILLQAFIIVALNLVHVPCVYVAYNTYKQWRDNRACGMTSRIPLYIALSDSFLALALTASVIYAAISSDPRICDLLTILATFGLLLNLLLLASIMWTTYVRVCHEACLDFGRYDVRLWLGLCGAAGFLSVFDDCTPTVDDGDYGDAEQPGKGILWCSSTPDVSTSLSSLNMSFQVKAVALFAAMLVTSYCYWRIRRCIVGQVDHALLGANMSHRRFTLEARAIKKINYYLLMFLIKWIMVLAYVLGKVGLMHQDVIIMLVLFCTASGVMLNIMQVSSNEFYRQLRDHQIANRRFGRAEDDDDDDIDYDALRTGERDALCATDESDVSTSSGERPSRESGVNARGPIMRETAGSAITYQLIACESQSDLRA